MGDASNAIGMVQIDFFPVECTSWGNPVDLLDVDVDDVWHGGRGGGRGGLRMVGQEVGHAGVKRVLWRV